MSAKLSIEISRPGRVGCPMPGADVPEVPPERLLPAEALRAEAPRLPELSEPEVVRHFTGLSRECYSVDSNFYPLGSCTMKYNPRVNEWATGLPGFARVHPYQVAGAVQGLLRLMYEMEQYLAEIAGLDAVSLQPCAGAHGELTSLMLVRAYHDQRGDGRDTILIPDSAHGTNPASSALCGYEVVQLRSDGEGMVDMAELRSKLDHRVAAFMITNPNTLGLFERNIHEIADRVHRAGGLMYLDGANMNAILGVTRPGDFGIDVMHYNLHKTFSTPHGGGGPGAGPIAVRAILEPFLPTPRIVKDEKPGFSKKPGFYRLDGARPQTIGRVRSFLGNIGVIVRAYAYIRSLGPDGLRAVSTAAVLNANYLREKLRAHYDIPHDGRCMHEFVASASRQKEKGVRALDIAKRLIDFGFHPPTIYFPLIVPEALMIEPTETESQETLDRFAEALIAIAREAEESPATLLEAPHRAPVARLDEVKAARELKLRWKPAS
jgi:glycine dehydrogenase subunit 2